MQFFPMFLEAREIGKRTVVWFDGFTISADIGPARLPLLRRSHFRGARFGGDTVRLS